MEQTQCCGCWNQAGARLRRPGGGSSACRPPRPDTIIDRCKVVWENFKSFNRDATVTAVTHALAVVRSHYPAIDLQAIGAGFARGTKAMEHLQLEDEVEDAAKKLAGDVDLFGEMDGDDQAKWPTRRVVCNN